MAEPTQASPPQREPLSGKLLRGAGLMVAMRWLMRCLGLINVAILARLLTPADFGLVAMAMVAAGLTEGLLNVGVERAVLQRGHGDAAYFRTAWTLRLCQGLLVAALIAAIAGPAAVYYNEPRVEAILWLAAAGMAIRSFESLGVVLLRQELRFKREFAFQVCVQLIGVVATIVLAFVMRSYLALVLGMLAKDVAQTVLSYVFAAYRPRLTLERWRDLFTFSQWSLLFNIVVTIYARLPFLILGRIASADAVGRLSVSIELALMPTNEIAAPVARAFFPGFVKLRDDKPRYRAAFLVSFAAMALIGAAVCIGFALVAEELVAIVLGAKWLEVTVLVQICAVAALFRILEIFLVEQVFVFARIKEMTFVYAAYAVAYGIAIPLAYRAFDLEGVMFLGLTMITASAIATGLITASAIGVSVLDLLRCLQRPLIAAVVMSAGVLAFAAQVQLPVWLMLFAKAGIGATLFVATAGLLWHLAGRPTGLEAKLLEQAAELRARLNRGR